MFLNKCIPIDYIPTSDPYNRNNTQQQSTYPQNNRHHNNNPCRGSHTVGFNITESNVSEHPAASLPTALLLQDRTLVHF